MEGPAMIFCRANNSCRRRQPFEGFTLIELVLVMFIVMLLSVMAVPSFSMFAKTSKLDQTIKVVLSALKQARVTAINERRVTAVLYGDDFAGINPKPLSGVLPEKGRIEVWTMLDCGSFGKPYMPDLTMATIWVSPWYPYRFKDVPITPEAMTVPDGVRVVTGSFDTTKSDFNYGGPGWTCYKKDPIGEILRHESIFDQTGCKPLHAGYGGFECVLVFEVSTGNHAVIQTCGSWYSGYVRPRIISTKIKSIGGVPLANARDLGKRIDSFPGTN
jgi:type II secretory pathway pseudopilin PulG